MIDWDKEVAYPGAPIAFVPLRKGDTLGDVRIQHFGNHVRVATFLPGITECSPGDTPKTWPENYKTFPIGERAAIEKCFELFVTETRREGWIDYVA